MPTYNELITRAQQVRDEVTIGGNTALRVGQLLMDIITKAQQQETDLIQYLENDFAKLGENQDTLYWKQSPIVVLKHMEGYDDVAVTDLTNGDLFYRAQGGHWIMEKSSGGGTNGMHPLDGVLYVNTADGSLYIWDTSASDFTLLSAGGGGDCSIGIGSFNEAWIKSRTVTEPFMWILNDTVDGDTIRKPIWHVGNGTFIDAVGAVINIVATAPSVPVFSIESGSAVSKNTPLNVTFEAGAVLYYTVNGGSVQTATLSPAVINITSSTTVEAWCENAAGVSAHRIASYSISGPAEPVFSVNSGEVDYGTVVSISFAAGSTLHYKVGNAAWATTTNTPLELSIESAVTIQAYTDDGADVSETVSRTYTIAAPDAPVFSIDSSSVYFGTDVDISWASGTLHYIINSGTEQTASSSPLTLNIKEASTVEAWAQSGQIQSTHVTKIYTMAPKALKITASAATTVTINGNTYNLTSGENTLAMSTVDSGGNDEIASLSVTDKTLITAFDGGGATFTGTSLSFNGFTNMVTFKNLKTTNSLTELDFTDCKKMTTCDMSGFAAATLTKIVFKNCLVITHIDASWASTSNVSAGGMFQTCRALVEIKFYYLHDANYIGAMFNSTGKIERFISLSPTPPGFRGGNKMWLYGNASALIDANQNVMIGVPSAGLAAYQAHTYWGSENVINRLYAYDA